MAKKAPAKRAPAKRKPRPKKPAVPADGIVLSEISDETLRRLQVILDGEKAAIDQAIREAESQYVIPEPLKAPAWSGMIKPVVTAVIAALAAGGFFAAGIWSAGGIAIGPDGGGKQDVLSDAYKADRATQVKVLRELAEQPFDGATSDGKKKAGEWFNANRFRTRADDYREFANEVSEAIAANAEAKLADELEAK